MDDLQPGGYMARVRREQAARLARMSTTPVYLGSLGQPKKKCKLSFRAVCQKKIGLGGPGGGPLDPDRDLVTIPGGGRSRAETATKFRPKMIFRVV